MLTIDRRSMMRALSILSFTVCGLTELLSPFLSRSAPTALRSNYSSRIQIDVAPGQSRGVRDRGDAIQECCGPRLSNRELCEAPRDGATGCAVGRSYVGEWNRARAENATEYAEMVYRTARAMQLRWIWLKTGSDTMFLVVKSLRGTYRQPLGV